MVHALLVRAERVARHTHAALVVVHFVDVDVASEVVLVLPVFIILLILLTVSIQYRSSAIHLVVRKLFIEKSLRYEPSSFSRLFLILFILLVLAIRCLFWLQTESELRVLLIRTKVSLIKVKN